MGKGNKKNINRDIFFAYQGRHKELADDNVDAIQAAIKKINHYETQTAAKSWEEYRKTGQLISVEVLKAINDCTIFASDISYFNHNVLFELGFAIAKRKHICE